MLRTITKNLRLPLTFQLPEMLSESLVYAIPNFHTSMEQSHYIDMQQRLPSRMKPKFRSQYWEHLYVIVLK